MKENKIDPELAKKHESDLTPKEKRLLERQKLASFGWGERISYIWMYYKIHMALVVAGIALIFGIVSWVQKLQQEAILNLLVVTSSSEQIEAFTEDVRNKLEITDKNELVTVDTSVNYTENNTDYTATMKLMTVFAAGAVDVMMVPENMYEEYEDQGAFAKLSDLLSEEELVKYQDSIVGEDAIQIEDSAVNAHFNLVNYEPAYLVVAANPKHPDYAAKFIHYMCD